MKRHEALIALLLGIALVTAGVTWKFGPYGLAGAGLFILVSLMFANTKGGDGSA